MIDKGFMSQALKYEKIPLGKTQYLFINLLSETPLSAYDIHKAIKKQFDIKNVRKTLYRLLSIGLIEVEGHYARNAIKYRLTSQGLFHRLQSGPHLSSRTLDLYNQDITLQTILYRYFEVETIKKFDEVCMSFLGANIRKCIEVVLGCVEDYRWTGWKKSRYQYDKDLLSVDIDQSIKREVTNFVFQIVTMSNYEGNESIHYQPGLFPISALIGDTKFMQILKEIKEEFFNGCKNF